MESEQWLPLINLQDGYYHDVGLRFRHNFFNMRDSWLPGFGDSLATFYDIVKFNDDSIPAKK